MTLLKRLWSNTSSKQLEVRKAYLNCSELSIKDFYKVVNDDDKQVLVIEGNYTDEELDAIWLDIYDEYCTLVDDGKTKQQLMTRARVNAMKCKLFYCHHILKLLSRGNLSEKALDRCFEVLRKYGYILNRKKDIQGEMESLSRRLRQLKSQIGIKEGELDDLGQKQTVNLMKTVVKLERLLKRDIDVENTSVEKWVYLNKEVTENV